MAKLKCLIPEYYDRLLEKYVKQDEIIEVENKKRIKLLTDLGYVSMVEDTKGK